MENEEMANQNTWKPVKDGKPEAADKYLVTVSYYSAQNHEFATLDVIATDYNDKTGTFIVPRFMDVIAWMEMPRPYRTKEEQ